jgi:hypothetical protein
VLPVLDGEREPIPDRANRGSPGQPPAQHWDEFGRAIWPFSPSRIEAEQKSSEDLRKQEQSDAA